MENGTLIMTNCKISKIIMNQGKQKIDQGKMKFIMDDG